MNVDDGDGDGDEGDCDGGGGGAGDGMTVSVEGPSVESSIAVSSAADDTMCGFSMLSNKLST